MFNYSDCDLMLEVACGKCGIVQHPTGTAEGCPIGGCHVCCQGGEGRGCNLEDGKAFFKAMYAERANPRSQFQVINAWRDWVDLLGIEKSVSSR